MDFSNIDIPKILKSGMSNRFMDFLPQDFEDFVSQLFRDNGYEVEQTKYIGDYGADIIIKKNNKRIAIQVKRYNKTHKVGVKEVNQVLGGKSYYDCNGAIIITTSSFTKQAENLAKKTGVELWDWNKLQKYICDTYLGGKDYYEYFRENARVLNETEPFNFMISRVRYDVLMKGNYTGTLIFVKIENRTDENYNVFIDLPTYITSTNHQIEARHYLEGYFMSGMIYAGCTVESCFVFDSEQLFEVMRGDKLVLNLSYSNKAHSDKAHSITAYVDITRDYIRVKEQPNKQKSKCFIATAAYGTPFAHEIEVLRYWRDNELKKAIWGPFFINVYYKISPPIADFIRNKSLLRKLTRIILDPVVRLIKGKYSLRKEHTCDF